MGCAAAISDVLRFGFGFLHAQKHRVLARSSLAPITYMEQNERAGFAAAICVVGVIVAIVNVCGTLGERVARNRK